MVVISEDDVICRSCGVLVNTLDRLETEMRNARNHVLRFLERKYCLKDGELRNNDKPRSCQPPQITRSCAAREAAAAVAAVAKSPSKNDNSEGHKRAPPKSPSWLQCDKCKYTTHLNSFMIHHLREHLKEKQVCDNCGHVLMTQQRKKHSCSKASDSTNKENKTDNSGVVNKAIPVEQTQLVLTTQTTPPPLIALSNCDHLYVSSILPTSDSTSSQEPMYILPDDSKKTTRLESNSGSNPAQKTEASGDSGEDRKQFLILKEDGSLEVVDAGAVFRFDDGLGFE